MLFLPLVERETGRERAGENMVQALRWYEGGRAIATASAALALFVASALAVMPAGASDLPAMLSCTFLEGGAWAFEQGKFEVKPVDKFAFVIRDIDRTAMTARIERKDGLAILRMVQAVDALHFIEVGVEGYLNLTTVYEKQASGDHPAVHSRHVAVLGEPLVSQYRGTCVPQ